MLAARTIGGFIALAAALLTLAGLRALPRANDEQQRSLLRSARLVGVFLCVWLLRDIAELALARDTPSGLAHVADVASMIAASQLAVALLCAPLFARSAARRAGVAVLAAVTAAIGIWRVVG